MRSEMERRLQQARRTSDEWLMSMMDPARFGLFRDCRDAPMPHALSASGAVLYLLTSGGPLSGIPGYSEAARSETVSYVQSCQDRDTGLFIDPYLDPRFPRTEGQDALRAFRGAVTKYASMALELLGSEPLYTYSLTGGTRQPDGETFVQYVRTSDWSVPWATGSGAAGRIKELFGAINSGRTDLIPYLERGMDIVLSHQDPETGLWGGPSVPLDQRMSGAFKIMAGPFWLTGFPFPYADRLAESLVALWDGGAFRNFDDTLVPRNVAELCILCLELTEHEHERVRNVLFEAISSFELFYREDGGFSSTRGGTSPIGWCGARVCPASPEPRSNVNGTQAVRFCLALAAPYIGWDDCPWDFPRGDWRTDIRTRPYRLTLDGNGRTRVVRNPQ